jgi:hypothetical protein
MSSDLALRSFRWIYVGFICCTSAQTLLHGHRVHFTAAVSAPVIELLAATEIAAALLFLMETAELAACAVLACVYSVAAALSVSDGEVPLRFLYYAATALYIVVAHRNMSLIAADPR